jgi:hypothetical protein
MKTVSLHFAVLGALVAPTTAVNCVPGTIFTVQGPSCSQSCGGGSQTTVRTGDVLATNGGVPCSANTTVTACNLEPCPQDCFPGTTFSTSWCSQTCGEGVQTETRSGDIQVWRLPL